MADDTTIIWTSVPVGSTFKLQCNGDTNEFDISAIVSLNKEPRPNLEKNDISPGPASIEIDAIKQRWEILPSLINMTTLTKAITIKARIEDGTGAVIDVPDGNGNTIPAQAQWTSETTNGALLELSILIRSVKK